jgi:hypothetical protein
MTLRSALESISIAGSKINFHIQIQDKAPKILLRFFDDYLLKLLRLDVLKTSTYMLNCREHLLMKHKLFK